MACSPSGSHAGLSSSKTAFAVVETQHPRRSPLELQSLVRVAGIETASVDDRWGPRTAGITAMVEKHWK